jgi:hypothetical protein
MARLRTISSVVGAARPVLTKRQSSDSVPKTALTGLVQAKERKMKKGFILFVMLSALFLQLHVAMAALTDGLVAHYPFSGNANDATGHGYNGRCMARR